MGARAKINNSGRGVGERWSAHLEMQRPRLPMMMASSTSQSSSCLHEWPVSQLAARASSGRPRLGVKEHNVAVGLRDGARELGEHHWPIATTARRVRQQRGGTVTHRAPWAREDFAQDSGRGSSCLRWCRVRCRPGEEGGSPMHTIFSGSYSGAMMRTSPTATRCLPLSTAVRASTMPPSPISRN